MWAKDKNHIDILANHWKTFNPSIQAFKPPVYFPPIGPGSVVRVGRVRQLRNATHPIRFEFGYKQKDGRVSPVVHLLNNLPFMPDGSALVIQVMWRKHWYNWKMNTLTRTEFISRGYDQEAVDLKVKERDSYYVDIRLIEIHDDAKMLKENYTKRMGTAFHVWDFPSANRLVYDDLRGWGRRKILRFINAIQDRNIRLFPIKHIRKPHFSTDEVASLIHPPPPGADVPNLMVVKTKNYGATPSQLSQSKAMEVLLLKAKKEHEARNVQPTVAGGIHGRTKKLTASDLRELRKRQEAGGQR